MDRGGGGGHFEPWSAHYKASVRPKRGARRPQGGTIGQCSHEKRKFLDIPGFVWLWVLAEGVGKVTLRDAKTVQCAVNPDIRKTRFA